jgi:hypothetical protein
MKERPLFRPLRRPSTVFLSRYTRLHSSGHRYITAAKQEMDRVRVATVITKGLAEAVSLLTFPVIACCSPSQPQ